MITGDPTSAATPLGKPSRNRKLTGITMLAGALLLAGGIPADASHGPHNGRITYSRYDAALGAPSLWAADPDGQNQELLVTGPTYFSDTSPDGTRIVFDFEDQTGYHIATIGTDGQDRVNLTSEPGFQEVPKWSPDGRWITYDASPPGDPGQDTFSTSIWVMRSNGSQARQVTHDGFDVEPIFSPDGKRILFGRIMGDSPAGQLEALYVINTDGTELREVVPARAGLEHPDWSPDGRWITFNIGPEYPDALDSGAILAVHPNGRGLHTLKAPTDHVKYFKPVWSPDGKSLLMGCWDTRVARDQLCTTTSARGGKVQVVDGTMDANWPAWGTEPRQGH